LRARVLEAMETLRYEPSGIARSMRNQSNKSIGLVIADIQNPYFSSIMRSIEERAYALQYSVLLGNSDDEPARERQYLELLARERTAGAIVFPVATHAAAYAMRRPMPMVFFDRQVEGVAVDAVLLDHEMGGRLAAEHLLALGHERIGIVAAQPQYAGLEERKLGYMHALRDAGITVDASLIQWGNMLREEGGYRATRELLSLPTRPTALMAVNNVRTQGMLRAVRESGLRVPEDISLAGFDDSPWFSLLTPPLTTVRQPVYEMGQEMVRLLMQRIGERDERPPEVTVLQPDLVVRGSTRAVR
jgi:DNA-binding LacI/PurR family transcriptional regulator